MKVEVHFFSRLRDLSGETRLDCELPEGGTVGDLLSQLYDRFSGLREWDPHILTAVELEYTDRDRVLSDGDSVSVMPPVQGG